MNRVRMGDGPPTAKLMIVGETWGEAEEKSGLPFFGLSGITLNTLLHDAGILRSECYVTNVVNARPPHNDLTVWIPETKAKITGEMVEVRGRFVAPIVAEGMGMLHREIALVNPKVIIALGPLALWALTGNESIGKWRGSLLRSDSANDAVIIPTHHPLAITKVPEWRPIALLDFKRAERELREGATPEPEWEFIIRPSFALVRDGLSRLHSSLSLGPRWIDLDLETKASHISCCGLSWSKTEAICIPFMLEGDREGYWNEGEETAILNSLYRLLTHPNCWVRGQNLLYDCQFTFRRWHFIPNVKQDTMLSHHTLWAGLPKSLAFQASMYCDYYVNWKPDRDTWAKEGA